MQSYISVNLNSASTRDSVTKRRNNWLKQKHRTKSEIRRAACKSCFQKSVAFLFSQVGVGALLVGYTILGAIIFIEVESATETRRLAQVLLIKREIVGQLWNVTHNYNVINTERWRTEVEMIVENFQNALVREIRLGYDGSEDPIWTFPSALMYSLSVFTTIGYGNLTPKTDWGKALTIFYALFGIPLLLLYMANVGNLLATSFRQFYSSVNRCKATWERMKRSRAIEESRERTLGKMNSFEGKLRKTTMNASTATRTKTKRKTPGGEKEPSFPEDYRGHEEREREDEDENMNDNGNDHDHELVDLRADNEYSTNEVTIPISTCLGVFLCYIMAGSVVFSWWESWDYLDGSYFCFVSLVTIGFGDLVPGHYREGRKEHNTVDGQLIFCSIYILLGMALMAMCFHLTQERFFVMARKVGKLLHLV